MTIQSGKPQKPISPGTSRREYRSRCTRGLLQITVLFTISCSVDGKPEFRPVIADRRIEVPTAKALLGFRTALSDTRSSGSTAITRILHYGDSHVASDLLTGPLRQHFQLEFGDGGPGFVSLASPLYQTPTVTRSATNGWTATGLRRPKMNQLCACGLLGLGLTASELGERAWITAHCLNFDVYFLSRPGGGTVDLLLDGQPYETGLSLDSDEEQATYAFVDCPDDSLHTLEIRVASGGWVTVLGVAPERDGPGVVYDSLGVNGARATNLLGWDANVLESNLERRGPDLIVIAYGSNEVTDADFDLRKYQSEFLDVLLRFRRAAPRTSLLVVSPPDRAVRERGRWVTAPAMRGLVAAQRLAALEAGAAFWNLFEAMGGDSSIDRWATGAQRLAQPDRVHLTRAGYRAVADALYRQLKLETLVAGLNTEPVR